MARVAALQDPWFQFLHAQGTGRKQRLKTIALRSDIATRVGGYPGGGSGGGTELTTFVVLKTPPTPPPHAASAAAARGAVDPLRLLLDAHPVHEVLGTQEEDGHDLLQTPSRRAMSGRRCGVVRASVAGVSFHTRAESSCPQTSGSLPCEVCWDALLWGGLPNTPARKRI